MCQRGVDKKLCTTQQSSEEDGVPAASLPDPREEAEYLSKLGAVQLSAVRNIAFDDDIDALGAKFTPLMGPTDFERIEKLVRPCLNDLEDKGSYTPLREIEPEHLLELQAEGFFLADRSRVVAASSFGMQALAVEQSDAAVAWEWRRGRGVYVADTLSHQVRVFVGDRDHIHVELSCSTLQLDMHDSIGDALEDCRCKLAALLARVEEGIHKGLQKGTRKGTDKAHYVCTRQLGFLTVCPSEVGSGMRAVISLDVQQTVVRTLRSSCCCDSAISAI